MEGGASETVLTLSTQHRRDGVTDTDERTLRFDYGDGNFGLWHFDILKSFHVKKPGRYRLRVQVRLFIKDTKGAFQPLILNPVEPRVEIPERYLPPSIPWAILVPYGSGFILCTVGIIWLVSRRRQR